MTNIPELFDLTGRVAVVSGGAGLLGSQFCHTLLEAGATAVVADINEDAAEKIADSLNEEFQSSKAVPRAEPIGVDITSRTSVTDLFHRVTEAYGRLDILVNSAAIDPKFDPGSQKETVSQLGFEDFPLEQWQQAMDVNLTGIFLCCQAAGKIMVDHGGGVIVNISSIYGLVGPDQRIYRTEGNPDRYKPAYYSTTKAGILGLTRYLASYYRDKNIRVNALTPGGVFNGHDRDFVDAYSSRTILGRMGEKDELNGALLFLASDASAYMTGSNLVVDGGWTAW
jgi:2-deoxy-D-gluconate 3-dehydrogenase